MFLHIVSRRLNRRLGGAVLASALAIAVLPNPAAARPLAEARVVTCGQHDCLRISGRRERAQDPIALNGRPIAVQGQTRWSVELPIATVRAISQPFARTIIVRVGAGDRPGGSVGGEIPLPIGLLGGTTDLALLEIGVS